MQEHPALKNDVKGVGTPLEIAGFLGHIDSRTRSFDGIPALVEHRVERLDKDGNLSFVVEVGELLQTDGILVFDPRFDGRAAVVILGVGEYTCLSWNVRITPATALRSMDKSGT